jgi:mannose-6-phosphate isomerase-like protein (cupin superfamily)
MHTSSNEIKTYETKDGSLIKELMHPNIHHNKNQSLAEAIVHPGQTTALHKHHHTEELYYITQGKGLMTLGDQQFEVKPGDTICILPGTAHCIKNISAEALHLLCCCSPAYSHDDTALL